jgi:hypothetical protein
MTIKGAFIAASVAGLFSAGTASLAVASDKDGDHVMCAGINACKGHGACKSAANACAGKNGCKGKGMTKTSKKECAEKGGTVAPAAHKPDHK